MTVRKNSPAASAGIKGGDRLIAVDGITVTDVQDAARRITSKSAKPVTVQLIRDEKPYNVTVEREDIATVLQKDGWKLLEDGTLVRSDATDAEVRHQVAISQALEDAKDRTVAFPSHYPVNKQLYYPGFEAFIWDKGKQVIVGGIEDGPASRAGVRWGDRIIAVNGVDPRGKSVAEVESLLSNPKSATMTLTIERAGMRKTSSFELAQAATVLRDNQWQVKNGKLVPLWVPEKYLPCFE
jgi:C-terminal processing protease CtpA/Prc